ncbi:hypothetical protein [Chryseobacterium sp.]|uniref:hypothetical protein n=1 Tax=Chryseobacterium sp. TaxID=1871047 RepID=UPI0035C68212
MSIANVLITQYSTKAGFNNSSKPYKNVKAVQVCSKSFSKLFTSVKIEDDIEEVFRYYYSVLKINQAVCTQPVHCFVRSYLHLLQLF